MVKTEWKAGGERRGYTRVILLKENWLRDNVNLIFNAYRGHVDTVRRSAIMHSKRVKKMSKMLLK